MLTKIRVLDDLTVGDSPLRRNVACIADEAARQTSGEFWSAARVHLRTWTFGRTKCRHKEAQCESGGDVDTMLTEVGMAGIDWLNVQLAVAYNKNIGGPLLFHSVLILIILIILIKLRCSRAGHKYPGGRTKRRRTGGPG